MSKKMIERISHFDREDIIDLPNLIEIQIQSYKDFLQMDVLPHERENTGLQEVFNEVFPIKSYDEKTVIEFVSYTLGTAKYAAEECIRRGVTYSVALKVTFRLIDSTGIKEEQVYMGMIPIMTEQGTFIVNGIERVIVSQLHRSPGICFERIQDPKGRSLHSFRIIPYRGSWLEATFDQNGLIWIYIDRKRRRRKVLATSFIRTLGYSTDADIIEEFFDTRRVKLTSPSSFSRVMGKILAESVVNQETEKVLGRAGEKLTTAMLKKMFDAGIRLLRVVENVDKSNPIVKMLDKDPTDSYESALKDLYRKIRPGEPVTLVNARATMMRLFFDPRRYNLGKVGRYKLSRKLNVEITQEDLQVVTLKKDDIILALKYLIGLHNSNPECSTDDIDHLGSRRVRCVGELIQNQCRIGLARMEKIVKERMNMFDFSSDTLTPGKVISAKAISGILKDFFCRSQLSQFMDQINPIAELTHKRRLSSLGPGGLNRERAGFEVRDVHPSHYGRICPVETPEGPNIGLITSLACFAKINEFGFIETPYRIMQNGIVSDEIEYMTADRDEKEVIAQASSLVDKSNMLSDTLCWCREKGEIVQKEADEVRYIDVSPRQIVSIVTGLIPFLEHDDAHRALMGSNMQRQAVPLLLPQAPIVGTGLEARAARDSGAVVVAEADGVIKYVDGMQIVLQTDQDATERVYSLKNFFRSNAGSCIHQVPLCQVGDKVKLGDVLADGAATDRGEVALGRNVLVAFMPWCGYNYEDAIIVSDRLVGEDAYTSIHIEEFEVTARMTKLGKEEITRDIPNISEHALANLDEEGIIRVGSEVKPGDILVGKIMPKSETELSPEERLLRAIFGEKAADVKDVSLVAPPGLEGVVMDVRLFSRRDRHSRTEYEVFEETSRIKELQKEYAENLANVETERHEQLGALLLDQNAPASIIHRKTAEILVEEGTACTEEVIELLEEQQLSDLILPENDAYNALRNIFQRYEREKEHLKTQKEVELQQLKKGDIDVEIDPGVVRQVKVYIAKKRVLEVGDKMAGRHGNKGVVAQIVPEADMPYLDDGTPVDMILNPMGVPSRMNMGQLLETHLGWAAKRAGKHVKVPVFEGFPEEEIWKMMKEQGLPEDGKCFLYDGRTGEQFDSRVTVGYIYMLKLGHLVSDKIHARSIGPYSLVTQQPLGGKAQMGGQRFGEMEVWALEAYGASHLLQEVLTVKSDDVEGRTKIYESIVKGSGCLDAGIPESFNVLTKELRGLGFDIRALEMEEEEVQAKN